MVRTLAKATPAKSPSRRPVAKPIVANAKAGDTDTQLLALEAEIDRRYEAAAQINRERVDPYAEETEKLVEAWHRSHSKADADSMIRFGKECGRDDAIKDTDKLFAQAHALIEEMWAQPAASVVGRAAKVRVFFRHAALDQFKGPDSELDWDMSLARQLLLEYAGMTEADAVRLTGDGDITGSRLADPKDQEKLNTLPQRDSLTLSPMELAYAEWLQARAAIGQVNVDASPPSGDPNEDKRTNDALNQLIAAEWKIIQARPQDALDVRMRALALQQVFLDAETDGEPTDNRHLLMLAALVHDVLGLHFGWRAA